MTKQGEATAPESSASEKADPNVATGNKDKNVIMVTLPPIRVLLLDDDDGVRRSLGDDLEDAGFVVDRAETTNDAIAYLSGGSKYLVAFIDIKLKSTDITGDTFILENLDLLKQIKVAAITAENIHPERLAALVSHGVETIQKLPGLRKKLIEFVEVEIEKRGRRLTANIQQSFASAGDELGAAPEGRKNTSFASMLEHLLLDWLRSRAHPEKKKIYYAGTLYSYNDIAEEIEADTQLGQAHLSMMASLFMRTMNLK